MFGIIVNGILASGILTSGILTSGILASGGIIMVGIIEIGCYAKQLLVAMPNSILFLVYKMIYNWYNGT